MRKVGAERRVEEGYRLSRNLAKIGSPARGDELILSRGKRNKTSSSSKEGGSYKK